jgi:hypothetical protein
MQAKGSKRVVEMHDKWGRRRTRGGRRAVVAGKNGGSPYSGLVIRTINTDATQIYRNHRGGSGFANRHDAHR